MNDTTTTETNALVALNLNLPAPTVVAEKVEQAFHTIYGKIEEEIAAFVPDVTTEKGRAAIASLAYKIARTKTGLDEAAAGVTADQKAIIDAVNGERRKMRDDLDALKAKVRAPLDAWEEAEKAKAARAHQAISSLSKNLTGHEDSGELAMMLNNLGDWEITAELYGEEMEDVNAAYRDCVERTTKALNAREKYEAEQVELEQLRREKAEREAAEASRIAEEERKQREEEEKRRQEEERQRIEQEARERAEREAQEKIENERREREAAEARAKEAEERAERERQEAEERRQREADEAKRREEEAARKAEEERKAAEERARQEERDRIERERQQQERERLAKEKADQERAADLAHRKKLNGEAMDALIKACELTEAQAKAVVIAICREQVPHVAISY